MPVSRVLRGLAIVVLAVGLGGCDTVNKALAKKSKLPCPGATILKEASRIVAFRPGAGRDITDIRYEARLPRILVGCAYEKDMVEVTTTVSIVAARGPAADTRRAPIRYFVAILDAKDRVIAKREFETALEFPVNIDRGATSEDLVQRIPLAPGAKGTDYIIAVGFQLSRAELAYNRANPTLTLLSRRPSTTPAPSIDLDYKEQSPTEVQREWRR
jgi:hypothetical protein